MTNVHELRRPNAEALRLRLPDMGDSLAAAAVSLSRECTLERCDLMLDRLQAAVTTVRHLRRTLAEGKQA